MAMNKLSITSEAAAMQWKAAVYDLNEETKQLLDLVGNALKEVQDGADSSIVDEIVHYGTQIMEGSQKIFDGMKQLFDVVGSILNAMKDVLEVGKGIVQGAVNVISSFT